MKIVIWAIAFGIVAAIVIAIRNARRDARFRRIRPGLLAEAMKIVLRAQPRRIGIPAVTEGFEYYHNGYYVIHRPLPNTDSVEIRGFEGTMLHIQFLPGKQEYALGGPLTEQERMAAKALFESMSKKEKNL